MLKKLDKVKKILKLLPYPLKLFLKTFLFPRYYFRYFFNDLLSFLGKNYGGSNIIFVAGYPKSGTTWVENFIANIPGYNSRIIQGPSEIIANHELPINSFDWVPLSGYSSIKTHINPSKNNINILIKNHIKKVVIISRDPRDIVVSNYYHALIANPWKSSDSIYLDYKKVSKEEAMLHSFNLVAADFEPWINGWLEVGNNNEIECLFLKYEDLVNNAEIKFKEILAFYNINLSPVKFQRIMLEINQDQSKFNPEKGNVGQKSTKRKGVVGSWNDEFSDNLKSISSDKFKDIINRFDY